MTFIHIKKSLSLLIIVCMAIWQSSAQEYLPTVYPDRITLSITAQPSTRQAISWRTDSSVSKGYAQIKAEESTADMEKGVKQVPAALHRLQVVDPAPRQDNYHQVVFEDLHPGTAYTYRVGDGTHWSEWLQFRTAEDPEASSSFSFIYLGDAQNDLKSRWSRAIRKAFQHAPDARFILHAGDLINRANTDREWGEWHQGAGFIHGMIPAVPTPGNHDHSWNDKIEKPVLDPHWPAQFLLPKNGPEGQQASVYYVDYQQVRIISLNSQVILHDAAARENQAKWLEQLLKNNTRRWTIVTMHHPIYSTAKNRDNAVLKQRFEPLFDKYGVDLVLQGHDHTYARGKGKQEDSPVYVLSVAGPKMYKSDSERWMDVSYVDTQMYQIITVDDDSLTYKAFDLNGILKDEFKLE
ncbi:purple acid phosphatase family protein [Sphingobacterium haloxyli]|uniref:Metallophosphoesterase n=1 Tax=Sphingobacterium haloxyli TaxID=2100533 RepID=A0A2S9IYB7_9SPHI|nr:metallophosphoesterase family protein [Sphingobacterium haloxyli]PRD45521.1 metallophosphoesterase [Sphingobacterium haloxyli]